MKLTKYFIFLVVFLFLVKMSYANEYSRKDYLVMDVHLDASVDLDYKNSKSEMLYFISELKARPRSSLNQEVLSFESYSEPEARVKENEHIEYRWEGNGNKLRYGFKSRVRRDSGIMFIDKEIKFPVFGLKEEDLEFTKETEYIDINKEIREKASEIVAGEDNLYDVVVKLAEWTRTNVDYSLNSLTAEVVQKSSWVLERRKGVCDEITNLFTSFLRSLNIPVRYVSGLAYSDVIDGFGPHAWNEVYFPNYGWVAFDVTFGQYGWVDTSHIKLLEGEDAKEPSVMYSWRAVDVDISDKSFNMSNSVIDVGKDIIPLVGLGVRILKDNVKAGSFVPIEVSVRNLQPSYVSTLVYFSIAPGIVGRNERSILLKPRQEKKLYWILNITEEADANYVYSSSIEARESFGAKANSNVNYAASYDKVDLEDARKIVNELEEVEEKKYAYDLSLKCDLDKNGYYKDDKANLICKLKNIGNVPLKFDFCLDRCKIIELNINEEKEEKFVFDAVESKQLIVKAESEKIKKYSTINLRVLDKPEVNVELRCNESVMYDEEGECNVMLDVIPEISELNLEIIGAKRIKFERFFGKQEFKVKFKAWKIKENKISAVLSYKDNKGEGYELEKSFDVNVKGVGFLRRIKVLFL